MQEQIISFKTAELAREKGFRNSGKMMGYVTKFYRPSTQTLLSYGRTGRSKISDLIYAPTQDLLQKWLREVHNIHITIFSKSQESWMYRITKKGQSLEEGLYGEDFYLYDEAREEALFQSLKLLPNVN